MGLLDFIRDEYGKAKKSYGLLSGIPKTFKNNPRNAETMDAVFGFGGIIPGIGDAVSAAEAKYRYDQGDMLGAGLAGLGALPMVPALAGTFIGKKGINNLGLADVLKQAEAMEKAGKSRDEIWEATAQMAAKKGVPGGGIGRGVDKQWRFEISDKYDIIDSPQGAKEIGAHWKSGKDKHLSSLYEGGSPSITQHMAMSHDDLFKAYPELRATNLTGGADKSRGSFSGDTVTMRWDDIARASNPQKVEDLREPMSTNLHELQHAIQQREGLARGGSPNLFDAGPMFSGKANDLAADLSQNLTGGLSAKPQEIMTAAKYGDQKEMAAIAQKHGFTSIDDALKFLAAEDVKRTPYGQYQRLAGEAEARLTQSRMNMTPLDRQMFPPWSQKELGGYDVPESQQIVRFGDGPAMSTGRPRNHLGQEIPPTPYELAHAEAQRVAALPVEQGGLGLPPDNTAMDRARAMGFNTDAYHGSKSDIKEFNNKWLGSSTKANSAKQAHFAASGPENANTYADMAYRRDKQSDASDYGNMRDTRDNIKQRLENFQNRHSEQSGEENLFGESMPVYMTTYENTYNRLTNALRKATNKTANKGKEIERSVRDEAYREGWQPDELGFSSVDDMLRWSPGGGSGETIYPLKLNASGMAVNDMGGIGYRPTSYNDLLNEASKSWSTGLVIKNTADPYPGDIYASFKPELFRSRFAAFNPAKRDSADLLAGIAPWAIPIGATLLGGSFLLPPEEY